MNKFKTTVLPVLLILLSSCSPDKFQIPDESKDFAKNYILILRNGEFENAIKLLNKDVAQKDNRWLREVSAALNQGQIKSSKIIDSAIVITSNLTRISLDYELEYPAEWLLVQVVIDRADGKQSIAGLHTWHLQKPIEEIYAFTFKDKGYVHYLVFGVAICVVLFIIHTLVLCLRTKIDKKWLWILIIMLGILKINFNWATGAFSFNPIHVLLFGVSITKIGQINPWILSFSIPLGAIVFLVKRNKLKGQVKTE